MRRRGHGHKHKIQVRPQNKKQQNALRAALTKLKVKCWDTLSYLLTQVFAGILGHLPSDTLTPVYRSLSCFFLRILRLKGPHQEGNGHTPQFSDAYPNPRGTL